ncbi:hypothetical protein BCF59_0608 [Mycoplasmopsis mustelae]|uniref:Uncharacterized protein n=1 Tax=Mycoplasmopsis mustelae TaxID=171289 RepID=A0A4R7UDP5_9BACT|nr:hypothetical protein [Mycoplasmopsis mustelae]TDV23262.1 hypothetical protein BCF59_0608 [Mycoplasmopsis mustelae]
MNEDKFLFILENLFEDSKRSWYGRKNNSEESHTFSVPKITITHKRNLFFFSKMNQNLTFDSFWRALRSNKDVVVLFRGNNSEGLGYESNKKKILNKISILDIEEIVNNQDETFPINEIWKVCLNTDFRYQYYYNKITSINKENIYLLKNLFYKHLFDFMPNFVSINQDYIREIDLLKKNIAKKGQTHLQEKSIEEYRILFVSYQVKLFDLFLNFFRDLKSEIENIFLNFENSNLAVQKNKVIEFKKRIYYLNKINKTSNMQVSKELKKRDYLTEIYHYKKFLKTIKQQAVIFINNNLNKYSKELSIIRYKLKYSKAIFSDYVELYKLFLIKKRSYNFLKYRKRHLLYLTYEELCKLEEEFENKTNFFINNIYKVNEKDQYTVLKKLRNFIYYEFNPEIDIYTLYSKQRYSEVILRIRKIKKEIQKIDNVIYKQVHSDKHLLELYNAGQQLKTAEAEIKWDNYFENKLFINSQKNKKNKVKRFSSNFKLLNKTLSQSFNTIQKILNENQRFSIFKQKADKNFKILYNLFSYDNWITNFLLGISSYSVSKKKLSKKLIKQIIAVLKLTQLIENISVNSKYFLVPYKYLKTIDKIKIKFLKNWFDEAELIIIKDFNNDLKYELKEEFIRVVNLISEKYNVPYIYVTDDQLVLRNDFQSLFLFDDNQLVESGEYEHLFSKPFSKFSQYLVLGQDINFPSHINDNFFLNKRFIQLHKGKKHYVYTNFLEYKNQDINKKLELNSKVQTIIKTQTHELMNALLNYEIELCNDQERHNEVLADYDNWILIKHQISSDDDGNY